MDGQPEVEVVTAARAGDQQAMDRLVAECLPLVYNIVGRALPDRADVDDVVQETMLRVLRGISGLRDPARFRSWLVAVAMSQVRQHRRSRGAVHGVLDDTVELADPGADFVDLTITQLGLAGQRREVAEATRWLDEADRQLLSLWWLEAAGELTRADLVAALELDSHHVTVRVQRMKAQLDTARMVVRALAAVPRCRELADIAVPWHGRPESLWRKRFARHVRECRYCAAYSADLVPVERLLAGIGLLPAPAYAATRLLAPAHGASASAANSPGDGPGDGSGRPGRRIHARHGGGQRAGMVTKLAAKPLLSAVSIAVVAGVGAATAYSIMLRPGTSNTTALSLAPTGPATTNTTAAATPARTSPATTTATTATATTTRPVTTAATTTYRPAPPPPTTAPSPTTTPPPPTTSAPATTPPPSTSSVAVERVLAVINNTRADAGLPAYTLTSGLTDSATAHNDRMAGGCGLSHQCPGEASLGDRETAAGVSWTSCGENIGDEGPVSDSDGSVADAAVALTQGMLSERPPDDGHRQNILSSSFRHIGIAVTRDSSGTVWLTQDFSD